MLGLLCQRGSRIHDSSEMDDGSETGIWKGGKQVVQVPEGEGAENVEMKPLPTSGQKITVKTKDSKADVKKKAEGESAGGIGFWGWGWIWIWTGLRVFLYYSWTWVMFHFFLSCIFPLMFLINAEVYIHIYYESLVYYGVVFNPSSLPEFADLD